MTATFALSVHRDYQCRRSGACCTSGWAIPVEQSTLDAVGHARARGRFTVHGESETATLPSSNLRVQEERREFFRLGAGPADAPALLQVEADGRCVFFETSNGASCAIHRQLGHGALPSACRHFPRVSLTDARGTFVKLSHYCPTAARLLFRDEVTLAIDPAPPAFPPGAEYEGLDAARVLPPLLRPGVLHTLPSFTAWEHFAVAALARDDLSAEDALGLIGGAAEEMRAWTPGAGPVDAHITGLAGGWLARPAPGFAAAADQGTLERLVADVRASVPGYANTPRPVNNVCEGWDRFVAERWPALARPVRRFLAAHAFASWTAYQGQGIRTAVHALWAALGVLRVECVRACRAAGRTLGDDLLVEAIRASDLWLVHLAAPDVLVARLSHHEPLRPPATWV